MAETQTTIASETDFQDWADSVGMEYSLAGLARALQRATLDIQSACNREFLPSPSAVGETEVRKFVADGLSLLFVDDLLTVGGVALDGAAVTGYELEPRGKTPTTHLTYTGGWTEGAEVAITGRFGYCEIADLPQDLVEACCILAAVRLNSASSWAAASGGVKRSTVVNVTVELDGGSGLAAKRQEAMDILAGYVRRF